jgi:hypothetical protein
MYMHHVLVLHVYTANEWSTVLHGYSTDQQQAKRCTLNRLQEPEVVAEASKHDDLMLSNTA